MKERLTGALILVGLVVVLVPELLSGPIARTVTRGPVSTAEEPPLRRYTINLGDEARGGSGAVRPQPSAPAAPVTAAAEPASATRPPPPAVATEQPPPVTTPPPAASPPHAAAATHPAAAPSSPPPAAPRPTATPAGGAAGYVVQLGSFASRANAERLAQQVHALGYPVGVSRGTTGRRLYRVQVGTTGDRAAAEQTAAKLRAQGHAGTVIPK